MNSADVGNLIDEQLMQLKLPVLAQELVARVVADGHESALPTLQSLFGAELESRQQRRIERLRRASKLPASKTMATFDSGRLSDSVRLALDELSHGRFLEQSTNVLAFGLPGVGKSHALCALGHQLVNRGHSVLFAQTYAIVQELLAAKRDLGLPKMLRKLDQFDFLILDDIGYIRQSAEEAEVLFTLLSERYERRSTAITSNLVFSEWERVFDNKMATSAAIDRLVHHSVVLEFVVSSYRTEQKKLTNLD